MVTNGTASLLMTSPKISDAVRVYAISNASGSYVGGSNAIG